MEGLGRIELGHARGVKGLGLIMTNPNLAPALAMGAGAVLGAVGGAVAYHTFDSIGARKSVIGKIALGLAGLGGVLVFLEGAILTVGGTIALVAPKSS